MFGRPSRYAGPRQPRNTAPAWKKLTLLVGTVVILVVVIEFLHANTWPFLALLALVVVVVAASVWGLSKLLGMHLSLRSWD